MMNIEEAKEWAAKELVYLDRRINYENGDPMTHLTKQGLKDLTDAREAIQVLVWTAGKFEEIQKLVANLVVN